MERAITGFHRDEESHWVAELSCGHGQHVRHQPPFTVREWVTGEAGRAARLGTTLDCARCDRAEMPEGHAPYRRTASFDESSVPDGLRARHRTAAGIWALIHVERGALDYHREDPGGGSRTLVPGAPGVVLPEVEHRVAPRGPVSFYVEFWRRPREGRGEAPGRLG